MTDNTIEKNSVVAGYTVIDIPEPHMGRDIYVARDPRLKRSVLLQVLSPGVGSPDGVMSVEDVVRAAASASHPAIIGVYEIYDYQGLKLASLEYIDGPSLPDRVRRFPLPVDQALDIVIQTCEALQELHEAGVNLHTFSPRDIFLDPKGTVRLFGRGLPIPAVSEQPYDDIRYLSPEHIKGIATDLRSCIFSLGCLLYELLSGRHPFQTENEDLMRAAICEDIPARLDAPDPFIEALHEIIDTALAKQPDLRHEDFAALGTRLKRVRERNIPVSGDLMYRDIVERAIDGICIIQEERLTYINQQLASLTGYVIGDGLGKRFIDYIAPDEIPKVLEKYELQLSGRETSQRYETAILHKDGHVIPVEINAGPINLGGQRAILAIVRDVSERLEAEKALRESRRALATLMANLPGIAYRCLNDRNWTMEFVSDGCKALTGYEPHELVQNATVAYNDLIHPDDRERVWDVVQADLNKGKAFQIMYRLITREQQEKWVWEQGCGVFGDAGNLVALEGFITDITEYRRAEEHLRLLSSIVKQSSEGIALADMDGNLQYVNSAFAAMHGYEPEKLLRKNLAIFHTPRQSASLEAANRELRETGQFTGEIWHKRRDGTVFPAFLNNSLLYDKSGGTVGMIYIMRDITTRKKAAEALRESEERFRTLSEAAEEGIAIHDRGKIIDANEALARLFSLPLDSIIGANIRRFLTPESWKVVKKNVAAGFDQPYEIRGVRPDGTTFNGQIVGKPYRYHGKMLRVAVIRDITELKRAEDEARKAIEQLEATFSALPDLFFEIDRQGCILDFRAPHPELLYRKPKDFLGKDIETILPLSAVKVIRSSIRKAAQKGRDSGAVYSLDFGGKIRWFELSIAAKGDPGAKENRFVALVRDITERQRSEEELKKKTRELRAERKELTEKNITLSQILDHLESQRQDYRLKIYRDLDEAMTRCLRQMKKRAGIRYKKELEILESDLNAILAKDLDIFKGRYARLTSRESEICGMIKDGMSSKQIAERLNLSLLTVSKHREQIRNKLEITNRNINLATYLRSH